jgi:hypothetical protein
MRMAPIGQFLVSCRNLRHVIKSGHQLLKSRPHKILLLLLQQAPTLQARCHASGWLDYERLTMIAAYSLFLNGHVWSGI